jgi:hypothetical protein
LRFTWLSQYREYNGIRATTECFSTGLNKDFQK